VWVSLNLEEGETMFNRRVMTFWIMYFGKIALVAMVVVPTIMRIDASLFIAMYGNAPSEGAVGMAAYTLAIYIGISCNYWLAGHKDDVDKYYDEKESG